LSGPHPSQGDALGRPISQLRGRLGMVLLVGMQNQPVVITKLIEALLAMPDKELRAQLRKLRKQGLIAAA
jgi:predicted transcriptional regulator